MRANLNNIGIIILAAGKGTRMKSDLPKVLHKLHGKTMIDRVFDTSKQVAKNNIIFVLGYKADLVKNSIKENLDKNVFFAIQKKLDGTGSAVKSAIPFLKENTKDVLILCGDVPLISEKSLKDFIKTHIKKNNVLSVLATKAKNPTGYGRIIKNAKNELVAIIEETDASIDEKKIDIINTGIYCIKKDFLVQAIEKIKSNNKQKEFYLTDIIEIAFKNNKKQGFIISKNCNEFAGVNTLHDLERLQCHPR